MAYLCLLVRLEKYLGLGELCQVVNAVQEIIKKARRSFFHVWQHWCLPWRFESSSMCMVSHTVMQLLMDVHWVQGISKVYGIVMLASAAVTDGLVYYEGKILVFLLRLRLVLADGCALGARNFHCNARICSSHH